MYTLLLRFCAFRVCMGPFWIILSFDCLRVLEAAARRVVLADYHPNNTLHLCTYGPMNSTV
jgi:hypothetical protein